MVAVVVAAVAVVSVESSLLLGVKNPISRPIPKPIATATITVTAKHHFLIFMRFPLWELIVDSEDKLFLESLIFSGEKRTENNYRISLGCLKHKWQKALCPPIKTCP